MYRLTGFGCRSGAKRKPLWPAIPHWAIHCRSPSSIIPASEVRLLSRSGSGSARATRIAAQITRIANEAFRASPDLVDAASRDLHWIVLHDPASKRLLPPLLNFKGYVALQAWRVVELALASRAAPISRYCCKAHPPNSFRSASIRPRRSEHRFSWITRRASLWVRLSRSGMR